MVAPCRVPGHRQIPGLNSISFTEPQMPQGGNPAVWALHPSAGTVFAVPHSRLTHASAGGTGFTSVIFCLHKKPFAPVAPLRAVYYFFWSFLLSLPVPLPRLSVFLIIVRRWTFIPKFSMFRLWTRGKPHPVCHQLHLAGKSPVLPQLDLLRRTAVTVPAERQIRPSSSGAHSTGTHRG